MISLNVSPGGSQAVNFSEVAPSESYAASVIKAYKVDGAPWRLQCRLRRHQGHRATSTGSISDGIEL